MDSALNHEFKLCLLRIEFKQPYFLFSFYNRFQISEVHGFYRMIDELYNMRCGAVILGKGNEITIRVFFFKIQYVPYIRSPPPIDGLTWVTDCKQVCRGDQVDKPYLC